MSSSTFTSFTTEYVHVYVCVVPNIKFIFSAAASKFKLQNDRNLTKLNTAKLGLYGYSF